VSLKPGSSSSGSRLLNFLLLGLLLLGTAFLWWRDDTPGESVRPYPQAYVHNLYPGIIPKGPVRFVAFGDSGTGSEAQYRVAAQMKAEYDRHPFYFALMLGDNIYPNGNVRKYGNERFLLPYKPLLDSGVQFKPALGNHDTSGRFTRENITFFHMPSPYYDYVVGDMHFYALNTDNFDQTQQLWLKQRLSISKEPWKIVYGHHPVYSSGYHGSSTVLQRDLKPLLEIYGVNLYMSGHDHNYERFAPKNGVTYVVSGGGGAAVRPFQRIEQGSQVRVSTHHFILFERSGKTLRFRAINDQGQVIDAGQIDRTMIKPALKPAA
jgi:hypothetical protein